MAFPDCDQKKLTQELVNHWDRHLRMWFMGRDTRWHFSGSRILSPDESTPETDFDIAVCCHPDALSDVVYRITMNSFKLESSEHYKGLAAGGFVSFRKGMINLVLTTDAGFYRKHQLATELGARLGLVGKPARIAWFRRVLYGESMVPKPEVEEQDAPEPKLTHINYFELEQKTLARYSLDGSRVDFEWIPDEYTHLERKASEYLESLESGLSRDLPRKKPPVNWRDEQANKHRRYRK
jgi:hypothetical protein